MGGFFGIVAQNDCVSDLFYGTDYHSHLGTRRGGMAVAQPEGFKKSIHSIETAQFRSKFADDLAKFKGTLGIGVISDYEDQPLLIASHLGNYAIVTIGAITNLAELAARELKSRHGHFTEMNLNAINPTELVASLINQEESYAAGIRKAQEVIKGSCSILILTAAGIYAARDRLGRTPVLIGRRADATAVAVESSAFPNLGFQTAAYLGPGEIVFVSRDGYQTLMQPGDKMKICSFLWIYYGYPASSYEGINVEQVRYRCGAALARADNVEVDMVSGIPDSGIAHAIGYAAEARLPYSRPFVKYTPTWPRSFMPQNQEMRDLIANMKLIPISDLIASRRMLLCEDSIVRGTQLRDFVARLYAFGGAEVHMRVACPPLLYGCPYLNFSRSRSLMDLAARRAISEMYDRFPEELEPFLDPFSEEYACMTEKIRARLGLTTLKYQTMPDMVKAIGLPHEKLCTFCWTGSE